MLAPKRQHGFERAVGSSLVLSCNEYFRSGPHRRQNFARDIALTPAPMDRDHPQKPGNTLRTSCMAGHLRDGRRCTGVKDDRRKLDQG